MKLQHLAQSYYIHRLKALALLSKKKAANEAFELFCIPFNKFIYKPTEFSKQAEQLSLDLNGLKMVGYRWNQGGLKRILIAHGFGSGALNFSHFAKKLIGKGYEVVAFDAPAHGLSEGKKITGIQYRNLILELIKTYGPFDGFLGHSFGCMAMAFAIAELPQNKKIRLAFIAPASNLMSLSTMFFAQMKIKDTVIEKYFIEKIERMVNKPIEWFTIKRCMQAIDGPVLWVHDKADKITPINDAYDVQRVHFPNMEFVFTEGLGHRKIYRDEKVVETVIHFLGDEAKF